MEGDTIVVKGRMYFASPKGRIFSLNAATGAQNWVYDPTEGDRLAAMGDCAAFAIGPTELMSGFCSHRAID